MGCSLLLRANRFTIGTIAGGSDRKLVAFGKQTIPVIESHIAMDKPDIAALGSGAIRSSGPHSQSPAHSRGSAGPLRPSDAPALDVKRSDSSTKRLVAGGGRRWRVRAVIDARRFPAETRL